MTPGYWVPLQRKAGGAEKELGRFCWSRGLDMDILPQRQRTKTAGRNLGFLPSFLMPICSLYETQQCLCSQGPAHLHISLVKGITTGFHSCQDFQWVPQTYLTPLDLHKMLPLSAGGRNSAFGLQSLHCRTGHGQPQIEIFLIVIIVVVCFLELFLFY